MNGEMYSMTQQQGPITMLKSSGQEDSTKGKKDKKKESLSLELDSYTLTLVIIFAV